MEPRALHQRADVRQRRRRRLGHRVPEQLDVACGGPGEAEQHPDQGGLARAVGPEHAEHGAVGDVEIDAGARRPSPADDLAQPERAPAARRPRRGDGCRAQVAGDGEGHFDERSVSTCSGTAPAAIRPSPVMIADPTAVVTSRPLPHGAADRRADRRQVRALSGDAVCGVASGRPAHDLDGIPAVADRRALRAGSAGRSRAGASVTVAPGGGVKVNSFASCGAERELGETDLQGRLGGAGGEHGQPQRASASRRRRRPHLAQQRALGGCGVSTSS